jgi:hypothetical protein
MRRMQLKLDLAVAAFLVLASAGAAQNQDPRAQRPTEANLVMGNGRTYAGTYLAVAKSRVCGELPAELSITGEPTFVVEFPDDEIVEITSIAFGSKTLVGGKATTDKFVLNVGVKAKNGGRPPHYSIDTQTPRPKHTGTATLTTAAGTHTLKITAVNEMGETLEMTLVCKPRP